MFECKDLGACLIWHGSIDKDGYGKYRGVMAHRVHWDLEKGFLADGYEIDHLCRVRACVNVSHLEPVTHRENMLRGWSATKTHCKRGHEFTPENIYVWPKNPYVRHCRACRMFRGKHK